MFFLSGKGCSEFPKRMLISIGILINLYCNGTPSVSDYSDPEEQISECRCYTVEDLFCCCYARYVWEAVKIRYPSECFYVDWEDLYAED